VDVVLLDEGRQRCTDACGLHQGGAGTAAPPTSSACTPNLIRAVRTAGKPVTHGMQAVAGQGRAGLSTGGRYDEGSVEAAPCLPALLALAAPKSHWCGTPCCSLIRLCQHCWQSNMSH
jgi:hypothetical protein